jgi:RNA polymerase sigma-70 factor (ECF subfamily)
VTIADSVGAIGEVGEEDRLYEAFAAEFGPSIERLAKAYEADGDLRRDLLQDIHTALWCSMRVFDGRCSRRTWVYRVAHNTAVSHVAASVRRRARDYVSLEAAEALASPNHNSTEDHLALDRLMSLIQKLRPLDKQVMLLYLEGLEGEAIAEITGASPGSVATKIHRIKAVLARQFHQGGDQNGHR